MNDKTFEELQTYFTDTMQSGSDLSASFKVLKEQLSDVAVNLQHLCGELGMVDVILHHHIETNYNRAEQQINFLVCKAKANTNKLANAGVMCKVFE